MICDHHPHPSPSFFITLGRRHARPDRVAVLTPSRPLNPVVLLDGDSVTAAATATATAPLPPRRCRCSQTLKVADVEFLLSLHQD